MRRTVPFLLLFISASAAARTAEPGGVSGEVAVGPTFKWSPLLGGATASGQLTFGAEYAVDSSFSLLADLGLGLGPTLPLRLHAGVRYRVATGSALSPFVQAQLTGGGLFGVLGANLSILGGRVGLGADYFFTGALRAGVLTALDTASTLGVRPAYVGLVDVLATVAYVF